MNQKGTTQKQIAQSLGISESRLCRGLKWYRAISLKKVKFQGRIASEKFGYNPTPSSPSSKLIRNHAFGRYWTLSKPLSYLEIEQKLSRANYIINEDARRDDRGYFFSIDKLQACISAKGLTIWANEKDAPQSLLNVRKLHREVLAEVQSAYNHTKTILELDTADDVGKIIEHHIAFTNDEGSVYAHETKHKILRKDKTDQKARLLMDASKRDSAGRPVPELEFVHKNHAQKDAEAYADLVEATMYREFRYKEVNNIILELAKASAETKLELQTLIELIKQVLAKKREI